MRLYGFENQRLMKTLENFKGKKFNFAICGTFRCYYSLRYMQRLINVVGAQLSVEKEILQLFSEEVMHTVFDSEFCFSRIIFQQFLSYDKLLKAVFAVISNMLMVDFSK